MFRWREIQLLPLSSSKSLSPPAKLPKLDACENTVYFTSGDEPVVRSSSSSDRPVADLLESDETCSRDIDSEVLVLQCFVHF